ncbi:MAG: MBL fold metallo-hydrolase [Solirubrobacterales bacterium]
MITIRESGPVRVYRTGRTIHRMANYYAYCFQLGTVLVDTSTTYVGPELLLALEHHPPETILNTHCHEDHTGNNRRIQNRFGVTIYAHPDAVPVMAEPWPRQPHFYLRMMWNRPAPSRALPLGDSVACGGYRFEVIHTPGHSQDHVCFYEPEHRLLFAGDLFCGERVKYLRADESFPQQMESVRKLIQLDVDTIFCAVQGAVTDGSAALRRKLDYMEELDGRIRELYQQGVSRTEIRKQLLGNEGLMYVISSGHFAKQHLVDSALGQLQ